VAAKPFDGDHSALVRHTNQASRLLREFTELKPGPGQRYRAVELLAELEHVIAEFRRLHPPPTFRKGPVLRLVRVCSICELEIGEDQESFETPGAVYHVIATNAKPEPRDGSSGLFKSDHRQSSWNAKCVFRAPFLFRSWSSPRTKLSSGVVAPVTRSRPEGNYAAEQHRPPPHNGAAAYYVEVAIERMSGRFEGGRSYSSTNN
jgi:hypothetical protein